jgi:hypothetical protein
MAWKGDFEDPEYKTNFIKLTKKMADVMSDFCVNALNVFSKQKGAPLYPLQIDQVIDFEIQSIIQQFEDPEMLEMVRKTSKLKFEGINPFR